MTLFLLSARETAAAVFGTMGAIVLIGAIIPPFLETLKSKKTYGISNKFFLFYIIGGFFFIIVSILIIVNATEKPGLKVVGSAMLIANIVSFFMNTYMFQIKVKNMKLAKEQGMCEMDYYNNFVVKNDSAKTVSSEKID